MEIHQEGIAMCRSFAEERAQQLGTSVYELTAGKSGNGVPASDEEQRRQWREQRASVPSGGEEEAESEGQHLT